MSGHSPLPHQHLPLDDWHPVEKWVRGRGLDLDAESLEAIRTFDAPGIKEKIFFRLNFYQVFRQVFFVDQSGRVGAVILGNYLR